MKAFAKLCALLGVTALFATTALAQAPPAPPTTKAPGVVKGYTRKTKTGKVVTVKSYTRKPKTTPATKTVKGYTRTTKTGKVVSVKGYTRKVAPKKPVAPKM